MLSVYMKCLLQIQKHYKIIKDVLLRYSIKIKDWLLHHNTGHGNVSSSISDLQKRALSDEPHALYIHCSEHNLNLVMQDSFKKLELFILLALIEDLINFVRDSPKRIGIFNSLQLQGLQDSKNLRPFYPTHWCVRIRSMESILKNYSTLLKNFHQLGAVK